MDSDTPEPLPYLVLASLERRIEELLALAERMSVQLIGYPAVFTIGQAEKWKEDALRLAAEAEDARKKGPPYHVAPNPFIPARHDTRPSDDPYGGDLPSLDPGSWPGPDALPTTPIPQDEDHPAGTDMAGRAPLAPDGLPQDRAPGLDVSC